MSYVGRSLRDVFAPFVWMWIACFVAGLLQAMSLAWPFEGAFNGMPLGGLQHR